MHHVWRWINWSNNDQVMYSSSGRLSFKTDSLQNPIVDIETHHHTDVDLDTVLYCLVLFFLFDLAKAEQ